MSKTKSMRTERAQQARRAFAKVADQLKVVAAMGISELREMYEELFNEKTASRNKPYLQKKISYRIQELAEGGLPDSANKRIEELNKTTPLRRRHGHINGEAKKSKSKAKPKDAGSAVADSEPSDRDPRLPPVGAVLRKTHRDYQHEVKVLAIGFEYKGQVYKSLSKVAKVITGTTWNGFGFFATELVTAGGAAG